MARTGTVRATAVDTGRSRNAKSRARRITDSRSAKTVGAKGPSMAQGWGDEALSDLVRQRGRQLTGCAYLLTGGVAGAPTVGQLVEALATS